VVVQQQQQQQQQQQHAWPDLLKLYHAVRHGQISLDKLLPPSTFTSPMRSYVVKNPSDCADEILAGLLAANPELQQVKECGVVVVVVVVVVVSVMPC
jgi:hypothetical protein